MHINFGGVECLCGLRKHGCYVGPQSPENGFRLRLSPELVVEFGLQIQRRELLVFLPVVHGGALRILLPLVLAFGLDRPARTQVHPEPRVTHSPRLHRVVARAVCCWVVVDSGFDVGQKSGFVR